MTSSLTFFFTTAYDIAYTAFRFPVFTPMEVEQRAYVQYIYTYTLFKHDMI